MNEYEYKIVTRLQKPITITSGSLPFINGGFIYFYEAETKSEEDIIIYLPEIISIPLAEISVLTMNEVK